MSAAHVPGVRRIAVLRANALGDLVFTLPALDALKAAYPDAELVLLARDWHRELLEGRPGPVDRVVAVPVSEGVREEPGGVEDPAELEAFFAAMRAERFDLALQLHGGGRFSNPFVTRLGARVTAGCRSEEADPLDRWIRYVYFQHEVLRLLEVAGLVGASPVGLAPRLAVTAVDRAEADALVADEVALAVLHPGAGDPRRRWPPERFARVGDALAERGLTVAVTGTGAERPVVDAVLAAMRADALDACDRLSLGGLAGLLARARVLVSNDSGPLHLGQAAGAPTVGIFWGGNLVNAAPPFRARHRPLASFRVHCPVCGTDCTTDSCEHDASFVADVPVDEVLAAVLDLLGPAAAAVAPAPPPEAGARR